MHRIVIGRLYHHIVSLLFGLKMRDVDCDFRLMRRSMFETINLEKTSGVICLEMMKKVQDAGFRIVEVPVHHFHRAFGKSQFFNFRAHLQDGHRRDAPVVRPGDPPPAPPPITGGLGRRAAVVTAATDYRSSTAAAASWSPAAWASSAATSRGVSSISDADVLLVDSLIDDYGGNLFNIDGVADRLRVNVADIRQQSTMNYLVRDREVIFNLAGQVSHIDSMRDPYTDLEINCRSQLTLLEACRNHNAAVKVVFAGTRQVYGRPDSLPVSEAHLVRPTDVNGINKAAGEYYHLVYNNVFGVRACSLRLTNVYGPRQLIKHNRQGFIGWFIRLAIEGQVDPDLRRRFAAARLRVRGRRGRRVSARGRQRRLQRRGVQRRRRRPGQPQ